MLVLSRNLYEAVVIDHPKGIVRVVVVGIRGDKVRLGIEAEKSITVHREEVSERIRIAAEQGQLHELENQLDYEENHAHTDT